MRCDMTRVQLITACLEMTPHLRIKILRFKACHALKSEQSLSALLQYWHHLLRPKSRVSLSILMAAHEQHIAFADVG